MKILELKLKKEVIIVENEFENKIDFIDNELGIFYFLCKGSELTEEIVSELVEEHYMSGVRSYEIYNDYRYNDARWLDNALDSLISAVESKEKFWLENPIGEEPRSYSEVIEGVSPDELMENLKEWQEAEEKTFHNPLIFVKK